VWPGCTGPFNGLWSGVLFCARTLVGRRPERKCYIRNRVRSKRVAGSTAWTTGTRADLFGAEFESLFDSADLPG
jgi:hypothetical protein